MIDSLFLSFREGLEAALIIAIIFTQLKKLKRSHLSSTVLSGTIAGAIGSAIIGFIMFYYAQSISHEAKEMFEGLMRLIAAGLIAFFILWLHRNRQISSQLQDQVSKTPSKIGLFLLAFLSVIREGMELVVFNLTQITQSAASVAFGSLIGIAAAIVLTVIIFKTAVKLNMGLIFKGLGLILIFLGGELFAEGVIGLIEMETEALEIGLMALFVIPSLYIFLKDDLKKFTKSVTS